MYIKLNKEGIRISLPYGMSNIIIEDVIHTKGVFKVVENYNSVLKEYKIDFKEESDEEIEEYLDQQFPIEFESKSIMTKHKNYIDLYLLSGSVKVKIVTKGGAKIVNK